METGWRKQYGTETNESDQTGEEEGKQQTILHVYNMYAEKY